MKYFEFSFCEIIVQDTINKETVNNKDTVNKE